MISRDEGLSKVFEDSQNCGPVILHLAGQVTQKEQVTHPTHLFGHPFGLPEMGPQPQVDDLMATGHQLLFLSGLFFEDHLAKAFPVVKVHGEQDVRRMARN